MARYNKTAHVNGVVMDEKIESVVAMDTQIAVFEQIRRAHELCARRADSRIAELTKERERIRNLLAV